MPSVRIVCENNLTGLFLVLKLMKFVLSLNIFKQAPGTTFYIVLGTRQSPHGKRRHGRASEFPRIIRTEGS